MTALFLVVLVLAWLVVFLHSTTRARHRAPLTSAERFKRDLETIALPRHSVAVALSLAPRRTLNVRSIRLFLFVFMCGCVLLTFTGFFVRGSSVLEAHLLADAALLLYVSWLLEEKRKSPRRVRRPQAQATPLEETVKPRSATPAYWDVRILTEDESPSEPVFEEKVLEEQLA